MTPLVTERRDVHERGDEPAEGPPSEHGMWERDIERREVDSDRGPNDEPRAHREHGDRDGIGGERNRWPSYDHECLAPIDCSILSGTVVKRSGCVHDHPHEGPSPPANRTNTVASRGRATEVSPWERGRGQ